MRRTQKHRSKKRSGAAVPRTPLLQHTTCAHHRPRPRARARSARIRPSKDCKRRSTRKAAKRPLDGQQMWSGRHARPASRSKAKASAAREKGRAALQSWRGYCETKGGRAYLVQHQYPPPISSTFTWAALSFVRPGILEELERATRAGARSRRARVPW